MLPPTINIPAIAVPSPYPIAINGAAITSAATVELDLLSINAVTTAAVTAPAATNKMHLFQAAESQ